MIYIETIKNILKRNDIEPSFQRIKIYQYLKIKRNHPNANMIYESLRNEIPTLSRTTVYNNLKLFEKKGIVLCLRGLEDRYDANTEFHGHFFCRKCGDIYDFSVDRLDNDCKAGSIDKKIVKFIGICSKCNEIKELKQLD